MSARDLFVEAALVEAPGLAPITEISRDGKLLRIVVATPGPAFQFKDEINDALLPLYVAAARASSRHVLFRGVDEAGLTRARGGGIDVRPTDSHWYASDLVKATEYGGEYPAILMIDTAHAKRTWLELPVDAPPEAHAAARAFAPAEPLTSTDGSHVFYSRLPPQDSARTSAYERQYVYCISGDPSEALLGYVLCTNGGGR